jgi:uncharacterized membrane protein
MAFCANCGSEVQGKFCAKCGTPVANVGGGQPGGGAPYSPPPPGSGGAYNAPQYGGPGMPPPGIQAAGLQENMASALCYLLTIVTGVLFLVLEPYSRNRNIRFHAFQSIFFGVGMIAVWIVVEILTVAMSPIPFLGFLVGTLLHLVVGLGGFVLWLMLMYKAYNNQLWVLPIIGPLAQKQA